MVGSVTNSKTGESRCIESTSTFVPVAGEYRPWTPDVFQANRLLRAALSFMMLLLDVEVAVGTNPQNDHQKVQLPTGQTVDQVIARVLSRRKRGGRGRS